ncbi:FAD binding domain-containing protein [Aspergillus karnatakaensis]|uniref:FAD binding domain-containing protein n=1 Tax=Aspergillus karnatakaensis TaxID=1810916 RepID=UPI003CCCD520
MSSKHDVVICGSGTAGLAAATWLARQGLRCKVLESRSGPLDVGQADGIQIRSVEIFESFGMAEELLREAYHNIEVAFWNTDPTGNGKGLVRKRSAHATTPGLSHLPRVILNQARFNGMWLEAMGRLNGQEVDYRYKVTKVTVDEEKATAPDAHPVTIVTEKDGREEVFEAKYCLASDGAHSAVRKSLGFNMVGETSDSVWGVMDVFPQTNFPDVRKQCIIQSDAGSIITIPREGGSMLRIYVELAAGTKAKEVTLERIQNAARQVFQPYTLDFAEVRWWSAYPIGQRIADHFSKANRVFLTGDACHTHSPKAGQGMNVSLQDGYNIGWKLASILKGQAGPELLETYVLERQKVADVLINWDKVWAGQMSSIAKEDGGVVDANGKIDFSEIFVKAEPFTAGLTVTYDDSLITEAESSNQEAAKNLIVGMRLQGVQVIRFCDAKVLKTVDALPSDGRWRVVVFPGDIRQQSASTKLNQLGEYLFSSHGPIQKYLSPGADIDSLIEVILILSGERLEIQQEQIPDAFWPTTGKYRMRDLHKIYIDDESYHNGHGHAYEFYGIDPEHGAIAIVRPDQYVSKVLDMENHGGIGNFFEKFVKEKGQANGSMNGHTNGSLSEHVEDASR